MRKTNSKNPISVGDRFNRLTVVAEVHTESGRKFDCICDCGKKPAPVLGSRLRDGSTKSCGCLGAELRKAARARKSEASIVMESPGKKRAEYRIWTNMKTRCFNTGNVNYPLYGGRGITVCERWRDSFATFLADMGERPSDKHSIDRFPDLNGNYEPGNCRWATAKQQSRNVRTVKLTEEVRARIDARLAQGALQREVATELGVSQGAITNYVCKKTWRAEGETRPPRKRQFYGTASQPVTQEAS